MVVARLCLDWVAPEACWGRVGAEPGGTSPLQASAPPGRPTFPSLVPPPPPAPAHLTQSLNRSTPLVTLGSEVVEKPLLSGESGGL